MAKNQPRHTCPDCGDTVELCDGCGAVIHDDSTQIWISGKTLCAACDRERLGRCMRMRMPDEITGVPV